jgi:hypothetical protein
MVSYPGVKTGSCPAVDKIPQEYSSSQIVQSSNFLPVVMDEIPRAAARSARTRFFPVPRDASLTRFLVRRQNRHGTGVVKIQTNKFRGSIGSGTPSQEL